MPCLEPVCSPLRDHILAWQAGLSAHPDARFVEYVLSGIQDGFRVGFDYTSSVRSARQNILSAVNHPTVVTDYVESERAKGRIIGPLPVAPGPGPGADGGTGLGLHVNRMGVIPKGHTPGKWRLITDLSFPEGASVNDRIDAICCSLQYTSVERIATAAQSLRPGALLAKLDVKSAYRLIPVHPADRLLLGFQWQGHRYVDGMLPFGLRSAPKIFTAVADALEWIVRARGVRRIDHYLDDFVTFGPAGSDECAQALQLICRTCDELGVPLALEKLEGPSTCLTFLGIEIDAHAGVLRLPQEKLSRIRADLGRWSHKRSCTRRELESLIRTLQHACRVVKPGRSFLRQMIDLVGIPQKPHHHVRLNSQFQADLWWWKVFVVAWNGVAIFPSNGPPRATVTSDASGAWGCGAWYRNQWLQFRWPASAG